jgi:SAM-dependent methyltransferase
MADTSTHISWLMRLPEPLRGSILARQQRRADELLAPFVAHLRPGDRILDIGSGEGLLADALLRRGFNVSLVDVVDKSMLPHLQPTVFDGITLPYPDDAFDVALLITVLHHIPDPERSLREASRVARRVIVMEDVYQTEAERRMTVLADSWVNWEWRGHPHSNRSDAEWRATFGRLGLRVADAGEEIHTLWPWRFRHATYVLERRGPPASFP